MSSLLRILRKKPFFLILLPLYVLVHLEYEYRHLIDYRYVWKDLAWILIIPVPTYLIAYFLFRKREKAALYTFLLLVVVYYFGPLKNALYEHLKGNFFASYSFLLPVLAVLLIIIFIFIRKKKKPNPTIFSFLNLLLILFILADLIRLPFSKDSATSTSQSDQISLNRCDSCGKPDIYYLIFDSYTSGPQLQRDFDYSNESTESFLRSRGFYIAEQSRSNYNLTPFSMASVFNMNYLEGLDWKKDFYLKDYLSGVSRTYYNKVTSLLEKEGYKIYNYSIFNFQNHPTSVRPYNLWQYQSLYRLHNIFSKTYDDIGWKLFSVSHLPGKNEEIRKVATERDEHFFSVFDSVSNFKPSSSSPSFVYGHFLLPHAPFSLDSNGRELPNAFTQMNVEDDKAAYLQQLAFTNKYMKRCVDSILLHAERPPIIIIQGDHGFRYFNYKKRNDEFYNLAAFYLPGKDYQALSTYQTNVNTFRIIFNQYLGQDYPMLKDSSFFLQYK